MGLFKNLFKKEVNESEKKENKISAVQEDEDEIAAVISSVLACMDEEETVAAITAAVAVIMGTNTDNFIVRNIKRTPELDSMWSLAGRMKLMR
jgi:sulfur transfer complex TusBCD TusB component (DsrH family)